MSSLPTADAVIVGAGVSGLTTAVRLAEAGLRVRVVSDRPPSESTSAMAGASWGPYMSIDDRIVGWSWATYTEFHRLAGDTPAHGIQFLRGMEASETPTVPDEWATQLPDFALCTPEELPSRFCTGWWYTIPLVDMPRYLAYLVERLTPWAGIEPREVHALTDLRDEARVIVNCTGIGAGRLTNDQSLRPTRGQLVVVRNPEPRINWFFQDTADSGDLTYFLPHGDEIVLGGSAVDYVDDPRPDPAIRNAILDRCTAVEPRLKGAEIVDERVGVRPYRSTVRLEVERVAGRPVVHNYGHGGCGVTASWGCAADVLNLVQDLLETA